MIIVLAQMAAPYDLPVGSNYVLATLMVGFLMSPITSALNRQRWSAEGKAIGAFVWCLLAAVLLLFAAEQFNEVTLDATSLVGTFLVVFVMAIGLYRWYFQPSGIAAAIAAKTG